MKKFQKISAALLATGLVASTSIPAFANDTVKVDSSNFETVNLQDALNNLKEQTTSVEDLQTISTNIPLGYLANNIFALSLNIEKINNPTAKAALQRNLDKAIAKWEEKNKEEIPTTETTPSDEATEPAQTDEDTVESDKEKTETEKDSEVVKAEKKAAKEVKKAEKAVEKQERKDAHHAKKQERKNTHHAKKEEHKASHHAKKEHRHEGEKHNKDHKNK